MSIKSLFENIADAIKDKNPNITNVTPVEMPSAIRSIPSGSSTAGGVTYDNTASGLTANNVQDAIDELAEDVSTINSDLSELQTYSTTEQLTGKKWIDGKPIYRKTYYLAQSTSAGSGSLFVYTIGDSPINMKTLVSISGQAMSGTYWVSLPNAAYDAVQYNIQVAVGRGGKVELFGGVSNTLYDVTLILEYTKTTD